MFDEAHIIAQAQADERFLLVTCLCVVDIMCAVHAVPGRSSSFGGIPTGRLPTATSRSTVKSRMLEHGVPSNNEEARRSMTRPSFGWRDSAVSSSAASSTHEARYGERENLHDETSKGCNKLFQVSAGKHIDRAVSPREQRCVLRLF